MNSLIPIEEAIYYLEETLRESSQLRRCYTPKATIFQNWLIGVNNTLTIIFGANSLQNTSFCGLDFGEKDEDESAYRMKMFNGIRMALSSIREYIVEFKRQVSKNSFSRDCFVAMWFDPCMEERYHIGIYRPLKDLAFNPIRVDKMEHNERIDQKIFDEIRRSRFVEADFTGHRAGVYYESGFASGLGLPVIHTCHKSDFGKRHFDVLTINTIVYETAEELAEKLSDRVRETII